MAKTATTKRPRGGQTKYTQAIADDICNRLSSGETLSRICKTPGYPDPTTVWAWRNSDPSFAQRIARAREVGFDVIADDCVTIADDGKIKSDDKRIRVDTRLRLLAKWDPKRYGDRIEHTHDITQRVMIVDARPQTPVQVTAQVVASVTGPDQSDEA